MNKDSLAQNKDDSGESLQHYCAWQVLQRMYNIFLIYKLYILKASACTINEQEEEKKRKSKGGDSVVQSNEGGMLLYQAQHFIKHKGTVAALPIPGILGLNVIICASFIPVYTVRS